MKLSNNVIKSILGLAIALPAFAQQDQTPRLRKYKEQEAGLAYTFSRVNLGGLNQAPVFEDIESGSLPIRRKFKNLNFDEAFEMNFNFLHTLEDIEHKVFLDLNYIHADQNTRCPVNGANQNIRLRGYASPFGLVDNSLWGSAINAPFFMQMKGKFDLGSMQTGVSYRYYRSKNIDFSFFGGADAVYLNYLARWNMLAISTQGGAVGVYTKSTKYVNNTRDTSTMSAAAQGLASPTDLLPYASYFKSYFYGTGPLFGAKLQVPFNNEHVRLNLKGELSALMGYNSAYLRADTASIGGGGGTSVNPALNLRNIQKHNFSLVPTFRGEISFDLIFNNFMLTGGIQQAVYFQALNIDPLMDQNESAASSNPPASSISTRERHGNIVTGGPFLKASYLF